MVEVAPLAEADKDFGSSRKRTISEIRAHLQRLLQPGVLGIYTQVAVYEVFAQPPGSAPLNVLTVAVLEEGVPGDLEKKKEYLTAQQVRVKGLKDWVFGAIVKRQPLGCLDEALLALESKRPWMLCGDRLGVGDLEALAPLFVPPDGAVEVPINRLLRNNFWNGSHVIRLNNTDKKLFQPFFDDRRRLQDLSEALQPNLPMTLGSMVDYLGDVLIQLPVTATVISLRRSPNHGPLGLEATWHPGLSPRPLLAAARMDTERAIVGASVSEAFTQAVFFPEVKGHNYPVQFEVWDQQTGLLVAATTPVSFLTQGTMQGRVIEPEPRVFSPLPASGARSPVRVEVHSLLAPIVVGSSPDTSADRGARERGHLEESHRLAASREFVQYRPTSNDQGWVVRQRALDDLRVLIRQHGDRGVDLWDPFLSADDVLQTLFYSPVLGVPLRALSNREEAPSEDKPPASGISDAADDVERLQTSIEDKQSPHTCDPNKNKALREPFGVVQKRILDAHAGNHYGLNLEFRARFGPKGWGFHDRFLIFPNSPDGPLAWSLGTSVNQLGKTHHILQRVGNAALIAAAFNDLWRELNEPCHQVWKTP